MYILGISCFYHDSAACIIKDGKIIAAAQEERFTRKKHDFNFPKHAINYCMKEAGIEVDKLDYVGFYDKPFIKFERLLESYLAYAPIGICSFIKAIPIWLKQKLFMRDEIRQGLGYTGKIIFPEHHESHAASAFYPSPYQEAAFLTIDGVGEWTTTSYGIGKGNDIEIISEIRFPHSLGLLYSAFTYYTGFKVNSGEYKLMGLAPYGEPKYVDVIRQELIDIKEDGSFKMNMRYFNYCAGLTMINNRFCKLFGAPPRKPETPIRQIDMDIAKSIQVVTEEIMLKMANYVYNETKMKYLCLAGGVALNCVANGRILREGPFDDIWIQPAAGDAGGALGAALLVWYKYLGNSRIADNKNDTQQGSYLGPYFSDTEIEESLRQQDAVFEKVEYKDIPDKVARLIAEGNVIGWFQGRMEYGPRALGARSIIGDARSPEMQAIMNLKIKYRESFRPFAPTVLEERASEYFEIDRKSPYMLLVADVVKHRQKPLPKEEDIAKEIDVQKERLRKEIEELKQHGRIDEAEKIAYMIDNEEYLSFRIRIHSVRSDVPAITHVDYSARIQTVNRDDNPLYYDMIKAFERLTGCPVIINTSFNVRGEPIVCTPEEAYRCFMRTQMDYLIIGCFLLDKKKQKVWDEGIEWMREFELD
jgi:carbamoyltransferase